MARPKVPSIPTGKLHYFQEQLARELAHLFKWENLPDTIPKDYLERSLIRHGQVLFYEDEFIGHDVLRCSVTGKNRHEQPVNARSIHLDFGHNIPNVGKTVERRLRYLSESKDVIQDFDKKSDGVLISNMAYGQSAWEIIEHFAYRLALAQQAFDTNLLYANIPYIFQTSSKDTRLSIEKLFTDMFSGKPFIITNPELFADNKDKAGEPTNINFIGKELYDIKNEIKMDFHQTVGIDTPGVEKAERVNTMEVQAGKQSTQTVVQVMKEQREKAIDAINAFYGLNVSLTVQGEEEEIEVNGGELIGTDNTGTENTLTDE